jgi:hypothetical protein
MFDRICTQTKFVTALSLLFGIQPALAQTANQVKQTPPVKLGTSGGNIHDASNAFCCSGTLGSLVTKGGANYILSNNHVLADSDAATVGDAISQPGLVDVGCNASATQTVANFSQAIPLNTANVDAAIAQIVPGEVDTTGAILEIGNPASSTAPDDNTAVGRGVAKSGRTTGLTCATIASVSTNVKVQYQQGCGKGKKFTILYLNQVLINSSSFSAGGDSGSLIVTSDTVQPIALLFAGSSTTTIGNRISDVTSALGVSFVGPSSTTPSFACPAAAAITPTHPGPRSTVSPAGFARAVAAKERHANRLMLDDAVLGIGVGASSENPSETVVVIYLEEGRAHSPLPAELDGVRTEVVRTDAFRAFGWNEPAQRSCSAK